VNKGLPVAEIVKNQWDEADFSIFGPASQNEPCSCKLCQVVQFKFMKVMEKEKPELLQESKEV
jgi:hypothetical protein